jgi:hypothetical protein
MAPSDNVTSSDPLAPATIGYDGPLPHGFERLDQLGRTCYLHILRKNCASDSSLLKQVLESGPIQRDLEFSGPSLYPEDQYRRFIEGKSAERLAFAIYLHGEAAQEWCEECFSKPEMRTFKTCVISQPPHICANCKRHRRKCVFRTVNSDIPSLEQRPTATTMQLRAPTVPFVPSRTTPFTSSHSNQETESACPVQIALGDIEDPIQMVQILHKYVTEAAQLIEARAALYTSNGTLAAMRYEVLKYQPASVEVNAQNMGMILHQWRMNSDSIVQVKEAPENLLRTHSNLLIRLETWCKP